MEKNQKQLEKIKGDYSEYNDHNQWGYSCTGMARKAVESLNEIGIEAKIYFIDLPHVDLGHGDLGGHALVVYNGQRDGDFCLNQSESLTKGKVTVRKAKEGVDKTDEFLNSDWSQL